MSENFNDHPSCHNNDILKHIDDDSQQECVEMRAPKAKEEILVINQDSDSDSVNELNTLSNENNNDAIIMENEVDVLHESDMIKVTEDHLQEFEIKQVNVSTSERQEYVEDYDEMERREDLNMQDFVENINTLNELEIREDHIDEDVDEQGEIHKPVCIEDSYKDCQHFEDIDKEIVQFEKIELFNVEKSHHEVKDDIDSNHKLSDENYLDNHLNEQDVFVTELNNDIVESEYDKVKDENKCESKIIEESNSKLTEDKRSKDIKSLSSTYNNEDNINFDCEICNKTVYPLEKVSANNHIYHKQCFRCSKCRCALLAGNFSFNNDKPYCRPHYIELFKKRGRYDEIDDGEANILPTNISDILTDELPAQDITKNLLAKFRDLEAGAGSTNSMTGISSEGIDELPAPNTTKNLTERFSALGKENDRKKSDQKRKPMINIPRSENNNGSGACENQPISLSKDIVRANEPGQDELPEQGITKNLLNRFRDLEGSGVISK